MHLMMWCWAAFLIYRRGCCWRHWCCAGCSASSSGSEVTSCLQQPCACRWLPVDQTAEAAQAHRCHQPGVCGSLFLIIWAATIGPVVLLACSFGRKCLNSQVFHSPLQLLLPINADLSLLLNLCQKATISGKENVKHTLLSELSWNDRLAIACKLCCVHVIVSLSVALGWNSFFFLAAWNMQVTIWKKWFPSIFSPPQPICVMLAHNQVGAARHQERPSGECLQIHSGSELRK